MHLIKLDFHYSPVWHIYSPGFLPYVLLRQNTALIQGKDRRNEISRWPARGNLLINQDCLLARRQTVGCRQVRETKQNSGEERTKSSLLARRYGVMLHHRVWDVHGIRTLLWVVHANK